MQVVTLIGGPGDSAFHSVELSKLAVVVVDSSPFTVNVARPASPLVPDGTLEVAVRVERAADFKEPLEVSFPCLPRVLKHPHRS